MTVHEMLPTEIWCVSLTQTHPAAYAFAPWMLANPRLSYTVIRWLVCQELTARRDFHSIFTFALVSQSAAHVALPLLYRHVF